MDFRKEIQNLLLSKTFERKLKSREPLDPKYFAISTDDIRIKELENYFEKESAWGKNKQTVEDEVKNQNADNTNRGAKAA